MGHILSASRGRFKQTPCRHPTDTREVFTDNDLSELSSAQEARYRIRLLIAVFNQQPAARLQMLGRAGNDEIQRGQTIRARAEGCPRLETQVAFA